MRLVPFFLVALVLAGCGLLPDRDMRPMTWRGCLVVERCPA